MHDFAKVLYLLATALFIFGIKQLSKVSTARRGNATAGLGMLLAIVTTLIAPGEGDQVIHLSWPLIVAGILIGGVLGTWMARRVAMTGMPEMVALFNGFGGLASLLVALAVFWGDYLAAGDLAAAPSAEAEGLGLTGPVVWSAAVILSILVGGVTLTGSLVAMAKLMGKVGDKLLPARHLITLGLLAAAVLFGWLGGWAAAGGWAAFALILLTIVSFALGVHLVLPIGGADMPVVISLLNSYSGIAASMAGFVIGNSLLIVAGALVGASGLILTDQMCKGMNRTLLHVLVGGFGGDSVSEDARDYSNIRSYSPEDAAADLQLADKVIIVPGYGMAVSQAQHVVKELGDLLMARGCEVKYAIHSVAGRMPGHMNVLLAEADVPHDLLFPTEEINGDFKSADVAVVVGANDVVNPAAIEDPNSKIAGMPILHVHEARTVHMIKRSLSPGYAGIKNPLFERDNCFMCFGDGKEFLQGVVDELKNA
ncbi:MAG: NAD(P)(+) transhydrogenase (Re/Si-specific) subunit beta [Planctomycetota bacterium]|nr:MAG: NAD(P)(+) transhydrogenase (Re/Si-specific) subunit beta [Planctomycetota bacterium]